MMNQVVGTAIAYLDLDTSGFNSKLGTAWTQLQGIADSSLTLDQRLSSAGAGLKTLGSTMTRTVTLPLAGSMAYATKVAGDFESKMSEVKAITGATDEEMERLNSAAQEMGKTTKFTMAESAEAMKYMAMAGWDADQIIAGLPGVLNLAAASGEELGTTSDIVTDALTAFCLTAEDSAHFSDVLAAASTNANTNVGMLGESFKYVAAYGGTLGYSIEDVSIALGLMANSGVKASQAGTALRQGLSKLIDPTTEGVEMMNKFGVSLFNADGSAKDLMTVMTDLRQKFGQVPVDMDKATAAAEEGEEAWQGYADSLPLSDQEKLTALVQMFGVRAMPAMLAIINASEEDFNSLTDAIYGADGAAQQMSDTMMDNLYGKLTLLKSNFDAFMYTLGIRLIPYIEKLIDILDKLVDKISSMSDEELDALVNAALVLAALGPVLSILGNLLQTIASIITIVKSVGGVVDVVIKVVEFGGTAIAKVAGAIGLIISGLILAVKNFVDMWKNGWDVIKTILELLGIALVAIGAIILGAPALVTAVIAAIVFLISQLVIVIHEHWDEIVAWTKDMVEKIKEGFNEFVENVKEGFEKVKEFFSNLGQTISQWWQNVLEDARKMLDNIIQALQNFWSKVTEFWNKIVEIVKGWFEGIVNMLTNLFTNITNALTTFFEKVMNHLKSAWDNIISTIQQIFENISSVVTNLFNGLTNLLKSLLDTVIGVIKNLIDTISNMIDTFIGIIEGIFQRISGVLQKIIETIKSMVQKVIETIGNLVEKFMTTIETLWNKVTGLVTETFQNLIDIIRNSAQNVWDFLENLVDKFKNIGKLILDKLLEGLKESWENISNWFQEKFGFIFDMVDNIKSKFEDLIPDNPFSNLFSFSGSHASGLEYVPYDGYIAQLHKGERVLTKNEAESYSSNGSTKEVGDVINIYTKDDPYYIGREIRRVKKDLAF